MPISENPGKNAIKNSSFHFLSCIRGRINNTMLVIEIPGKGIIRLEKLLIDLNGTLATDGVVAPKNKDNDKYTQSKA